MYDPATVESGDQFPMAWRGCGGAASSRMQEMLEKTNGLGVAMPCFPEWQPQIAAVGASEAAAPRDEGAGESPDEVAATAARTVHEDEVPTMPPFALANHRAVYATSANRMVEDCRRSNCYFRAPHDGSLASWEALGRFEIHQGDGPHTSSADLKDSFYHLGLPKMLHRNPMDRKQVEREATMNDNMREEREETAALCRAMARRKDLGKMAGGGGGGPESP